VLGNAVELCQPPFGKAPEGLDAVDVMLFPLANSLLPWLTLKCLAKPMSTRTCAKLSYSHSAHFLHARDSHAPDKDSPKPRRAGRNTLGPVVIK